MPRPLNLAANYHVKRNEIAKNSSYKSTVSKYAVCFNTLIIFRMVIYIYLPSSIFIYEKIV